MTTYHIDAELGDDRNSGTSADKPWLTLARIRRQPLRPGDTVLLRRGRTWTEQLRISGSGRKDRLITLGTYGAGPRPRIMADRFPVVANDGPVSWWRIKGLEVRGVAAFDPHGQEQNLQHGIAISQAVPSQGMTIEDCVVHDVGGKGILFNAERTGITVFTGWTVSGCEVYNAGTGIATDGPWPPPADLQDVFRCHDRCVVERCRTHDIATDGIVLYYCQDGMVDHCLAWRTGVGRTGRTPVGIWFFLAQRCIIQHCESYDNHTAGGKADGGGFDLDGGCVECIMQYNYSHDNDGAGYLVCSYDPAKAPTTRCITRYNLSVNDGRMNDYAAIQLWQANDCTFHNNTCITRLSAPLKFASDSSGLLFANNVFIVDTDSDVPLVKSPFAISANRFLNNLYWRSGGKTHFEIQNEPRLNLKAFAALTGADHEISVDPRLSALHGRDIHPRNGSRLIHSGWYVPGDPGHDLYGVPLSKTEPPNIGASQRAT